MHLLWRGTPIQNPYLAGLAKRLIDPGSISHRSKLVTRLAEQQEIRTKKKQGSIFSQKPFLACIGCNTGWMKNFEDEMLKFAPPIFTGEQPVDLTQYQIRVFVGWMSLITVLAQYTKPMREGLVITREEREHLMRNLKPPDDWSIFAASQNIDPYVTGSWFMQYRTHTKGLHHFSVPNPGAPHGWNTQISSFGMGRVFAQTFVTRSSRIVSDYRLAMKAKDLIQIWPLPAGFWPFTKGTAHFPTKLVLDQDTAEFVADGFMRRLEALYTETRALPG